MPNCFQLSRKSEPENGPVSLNQIDRELCAFMGVEEHPKMYCLGWFDWIGFCLATGGTYATIRQTIDDWRDPNNRERDLRILQWFEDNFTPDAWVEIGRSR